MPFIILECAQCNYELNRSVEMTSEEINKNWSLMCISSALVAGQCPNGCPSTFSDCNINTTIYRTDKRKN